MKIDQPSPNSKSTLGWVFLIGCLVVFLFVVFFKKDSQKNPSEKTENSLQFVKSESAEDNLEQQMAAFDPEEIHDSTLPLAKGPDGYKGSSTCLDCHESEYHSWHDSYHRSMTQIMSHDTVQADFDGVELETKDEIFTLFTRGDEYWVRITDRQPPLAGEGASLTPTGIELRMGMMTGSHHMQVFWLPAYHGNMQIGFPFTWLIKDQKWVPRESTFIRDPHAISKPEIWNLSCIRCHVTAGIPGHDPATDEMISTAADLGISCEACHGPGEQHVEWRKQIEIAKNSGNRMPEGEDPIIQPDLLEHDRSTQVCGQCHGMKWWDETEEWRQTGFDYRPGDDLMETTPIVQPTKIDDLPWLQNIVEKNPTLLRDFFWSDGMMRVSGREYNGLLETACHQSGEMSCLSCHSMHKSDPNDMLAKNMDGNQACLQCHTSFESELESHTHHPATSEGSLCYNCHMPHTTFSLLSAIRSHEVDSPNANVSKDTGRPSACNLCHVNETLDWTAKKLNEWYDQPLPELDREDQLFSQLVKQLLKGDAGQRALAAWHLGWETSKQVSGTHWQPRFLAELLDDPYSAVRYVAHQSLQTFQGFESFQYDYVADDKILSESQDQAIEIWGLQQSTPQFGQDDRIIVDEQGKVDRAIVQSLLDQRDDTPIRLRE